MDPLHKKVLAIKTSEIMHRISNPGILCGLLAPIFTISDTEEIHARNRQYGPTNATQHLISVLEKRGTAAFSFFLKVLEDPQIKQDELAAELRNEERRLRGEAVPPPEVPVRGAERSPPVPEEPIDHKDYTSGSPPPPYSSPLHVRCDSAEAYDYSSGLQSQAFSKQAPAAEDSSESYQDQSSPVVVTRDSLVKDIPYSLRTKVEKMMNPPDPNNHDWRGLAGAMDMSADEVRQLEGHGEAPGKMAGLFNRMIHTKKTVNDLIELLTHEDVNRLDVIDEILHACKLPRELGTEIEGSDNKILDSKEETFSLKESCKSAASAKSLPYPRQESQEAKESNGKPDARPPCQVEYDDDPKTRGQAELGTKADARVPSQVEDDDDPGVTNKRHHRLTCQEEDDDEESVFYDAVEVAEVKKHALLVSCFRGNIKKEKLHDAELRNLEGMLENSGWEVTRKPKCKMADLLQTVHSFLTKLEDSRNICFVYLVGSTVNINNKNYLLPADLESPSSRADLIHSSLNINWLVEQLNKNYMQVVVIDGAHKNVPPGVHNINGVLQGLAPMHPPPNAVIAFPCQPGTIRTDEERLDYIKSVIKYAREERMSLKGLFDKVREDLSQRQPAVSLPLEFSLTSSLPPFCLNPEDHEGLAIRNESNVSSKNSIIVSNSKYDGLSINTQDCMRHRESLRMALLKNGWQCEEICDKSAKEIMEDLRIALHKWRDSQGVVMLYFMGYTKVIMECNYFFGKDFRVGCVEPLRSSVPLQWCLDLMCEKLQSRKILIVDDLNPSTAGLAPMTTPLDVMISLPKAADSRHPDGSSFTSKFVHLLETKTGQLSLKDMVKKAASFERHRLSSSWLN